MRCEHFDYSTVQNLFGKPSALKVGDQVDESDVYEDFFEEIKDENGVSRGLHKFTIGALSPKSTEDIIKMKWITNYPLPILACLVKSKKK